MTWVAYRLLPRRPRTGLAAAAIADLLAGGLLALPACASAVATAGEPSVGEGNGTINDGNADFGNPQLTCGS